MKICSVEDCQYPVFGKDFCKNHQYLRQDIKKPSKKNSKAPLRKKSIKKVSKQGELKKMAKKASNKVLHDWFLYLWDKQQDSNGYCYCFETERPMKREIYRENLCVYSHILPKSTYPQYAMEEWNVKIVLPDQHALFESRSPNAVKQMGLFIFYKENITELHKLAEEIGELNKNDKDGR